MSFQLLLSRQNGATAAQRTNLLLPAPSKPHVPEKVSPYFSIPEKVSAADGSVVFRWALTFNEWKISAHTDEPKLPGRMFIASIQRIVARYHNISRNEMISSSRKDYLVLPRQVAMYLAKILIERSLPEIGFYSGERDHTTTLYAIRKIKKRATEDSEFALQLKYLKYVCVLTHNTKMSRLETMSDGAGI